MQRAGRQAGRQGGPLRIPALQEGPAGLASTRAGEDPQASVPFRTRALSPLPTISSAVVAKGLQTQHHSSRWALFCVSHPEV